MRYNFQKISGTRGFKDYKFDKVKYVSNSYNFTELPCIHVINIVYGLKDSGSNKIYLNVQTCDYYIY